MSIDVMRKVMLCLWDFALVQRKLGKLQMVLSVGLVVDLIALMTKLEGSLRQGREEEEKKERRPQPFTEEAVAMVGLLSFISEDEYRREGKRADGQCLEPFNTSTT